VKIEVYSPTIRRKEMDAVLTALVADQIGPGEQARILLQYAKDALGFDYCLALRSPAIALYNALKLLNIEDGQGVVLSALSPCYYLRVIEDLRLTPVYCDVPPASACPSRETIEAAIAAAKDGVAPVEPRCIVLHHTLGFVPDTAAISQLGLPIIEDISQSYGTIKEESKPLSASTFSILGLEAEDMLTAGCGALLYAVNRRDATVLRSLGELPPEYRLPDMNAVMATVQFREAAKNLVKRKNIAEVYIQAAQRTRHKRFIQAETYNNYAFPLILETGLKDVRAYAKRKEIAIQSAFEHTLVGSGALGGGGGVDGSSSPPCPESYTLSLRTVMFPLYPRLGSSDIEKVAKLIGTLP
jgi:dTDP-4-amino-4,6-dideoxygalactose transaminase